MAKTKKAVEEEQGIPSLARVVAEVNKSFGDQIIGTFDKMENAKIERLPTNITSLDRVLGGGFPMGRMIELYGLPSGGKSLISLLTIAQAQKKGLECVYIDAENSFDPSFATKLGVDVGKLVIAQISLGEDIIDMLTKILKAEPGVIVVDSVAAMITRAEFEESADQQFMAVKARLMSRGLPKLNMINKKTLIIFINQLRSTLVMYGTPTTTPGGRALPHFASIRLEVKQGDKLTVDNKKTGDIIGQVVQFQAKKNKTSEPYQYGSFKFWYDGCRIEE